MNDQTKTNVELSKEISTLKQRIKELEQLEPARKQVEKALWNSEEKFRTIFDRASDGILIAILDNLPFLAWLKDSEGRFVAVNEPFAHSCGLSSANELVGRTDLDIWPQPLAEAYEAVGDRVFPD